MFFITQAYAADVYVDVYKTKQFTASDLKPIIDKYRQQALSGKKHWMESNYPLTAKFMEPLYNELKKEVPKKGDFAFVKISGAEYIKDPSEYITVNVVDAADKGSLPVYLPNPKGHYKDPAHLLRDWDRYTRVFFPLALSGKIDSNSYHCKELHCLGPFSTPALKKFEVEFNTNVPKYAKELATILRDDADPKKRENASMLLGHTTDEKQLMAWELPAVNDSDEGVRNNATRVIAVLASKDTKITLPVETFIKMAHSPVLTDRNKSISVLMALGRQQRYAAIIKKEAAQDLMDNLKLLQPDLHSAAYWTLVVISDQHYGERDYAAWSKWLGLA